MKKRIVFTIDRSNPFHYIINVNTELPESLVEFLKKTFGVESLVKITRYQMELQVGKLFPIKDTLLELEKRYLSY